MAGLSSQWRYSTRVRALCGKFDLPYTTGSLLGQYLQTVRTIHKLAPAGPLPGRHRR